MSIREIEGFIVWDREKNTTLFPEPPSEPATEITTEQIEAAARVMGRRHNLIYVCHDGLTGQLRAGLQFDWVDEAQGISIRLRDIRDGQLEEVRKLRGQS